MIISGGGVVMGGGVDAVVQLAEALKARNIFDILTLELFRCDEMISLTPTIQ